MEKVEKLPKVFKKKWIKALRSGKYKQGEGKLFKKDENTYCCLGVAAHICGATNLAGKDFILKGRGIKGISKIPDLIKGDGHIAEFLSNLNDNGDSFEGIADYIEENL